MLARLVLTASLLVISTSAPLRSQVAVDDSVAAATRTAGLRLAGSRAVLWVGPGALDAAESARFLAALDTGIAALERLLGRTLDRAHYGEDTIQVFVAEGVGVSHVYGGYAHPRHDKPYLYLDAARVRAGEAPYLHEATHLLVRRFGSHSLREGVASWAESEVIATGVGIGTGLFGSGAPDQVDARAAALVDSLPAPEVLAAIGRGGMADPAVTSPRRPRVRAAYYLLSQSFAQYLVRTLGAGTTLRLYEEATRDDTYLDVAGMSLDSLKDGWLRSLRHPRTPTAPANGR
jgi:hypothetical protein